MAKLRLDDSSQSMIEHSEQSVLIVTKNIINLYARPDSSSEIVTQALLNSRFELEREEGGFAYVTGSDRYRGWVDSRHIEKLSTAGVSVSRDPRFIETKAQRLVHSAPCATVNSLIADVYADADVTSELLTKLVISSVVENDDTPNHGEFVAVKLPGALRGWIRRTELSFTRATTLNDWSELDHQSRVDLIKNLGQKALSHAERFIGVPYLWGGCSPFGIDCSALVQIGFLMEGLSLLRDADLQFADKRFCKIEEGKSLREAHFQAGDLPVFGKNNVITHIGIASDNGRFLHASGRQCNFGTYYDLCSDEGWGKIYMGAVRLSTAAELSIGSA